MTDNSILAWLSQLSHTNAERLKVVVDLLKHANGDGMTEEDRIACRRAIILIKGGKAIETSPRLARPIFSDEEEEQLQ